jgi:hypothetical protein
MATRHLAAVAFAVTLAVAGTCTLAEAQLCGGPGCNSTHAGCEFTHASENRYCCCNVNCDSSGCTCTSHCWVSCKLPCPNDCGTCASFAGSSTDSFRVSGEAHKKIAQTDPFIALLLANLSRELQHPIRTQFAEGGTTVLSPPAGVRYRVNLTASPDLLTLDLVFSPTELDNPSPHPPGPVPKPTRITVNASGDVVAAPLPAPIAENVRTFVPPSCDVPEPENTL